MKYNQVGQPDTGKVTNQITYGVHMVTSTIRYKNEYSQMSK